jgi:hypothetical protein
MEMTFSKHARLEVGRRAALGGPGWLWVVKVYVWSFPVAVSNFMVRNYANRVNLSRNYGTLFSEIFPLLAVLSRVSRRTERK